MTTDRHVKITDFGIAWIEMSSITQAGTMLGTPAYMSPEQFMGQTVDARTDVYAAGVVLYQLLTGERPFDGNSLTTIMQKVLNTEPLLPSQLSVVSPKALDAVVQRALAKRPEARYSSATAFARAIRAAVAAPAADVPDEDLTIALPGLAETPDALVADVGETLAEACALQWDGDSVEPALHRAVDLLRTLGTSGGPAIAMTGAVGVFLHDGEPILPRVTMPGFRGALRVDYFINDGRLTHLFPTVAERAGSQRIAAQSQRTFGAHDQITLGHEGRDTTGALLPSWKPGKPYGTDMILAIASSLPLDIAPAHNVEPDAAAYFDRLAAEIHRVRLEGAQVTGTALLLHTLPPK